MGLHKLTIRNRVEPLFPAPSGEYISQKTSPWYVTCSTLLRKAILLWPRETNIHIHGYPWPYPKFVFSILSECISMYIYTCGVFFFLFFFWWFYFPLEIVNVFFILCFATIKQDSFSMHWQCATYFETSKDLQNYRQESLMSVHFLSAYGN